ncbi:diaminohydroxyphosphoribosylaminopyrimidine deaminase/5-amino-6-(5-phosphoribosylamino)uracil reductase [Balneicella halophila]|uniref:Riboflavin biosynthesis protein RibD n=1 Tax=Balneicella halophila TaxID=1537566 RepID=A0A7L4UNY7_BALHA|nr:bifunctional diaminohydroxyphosphoribosylaminopyrimidine deaminase/5-amino-6-(5-phosphoribosylamino)uracil reductase RibD [Balneicella halophila]PVX50048.1 diaminohydroxyphosphoribosylaminopyrimidine deaminase/5-amino-6-(5-phosphoribosylamino)uracil reductase [Balneicella halophila]
MQEIHNTFMKRALSLASKGKGFVNPNPMVGAVLVKDGEVIGEGYHTAFGKPHAEIEAIRNTRKSVDGATIYVTLEPCSHYGKTPPCAEALIKAGVKEVVIASLDPNPLVAGRGVKMLEDAGIKVIVGIEEEASKELNRIFFKYIQTKTPYVLMKTAMTLDGKIATHTGDSKWVSGEISRKKVHQLRHQLMGIMVGINTVLKDSPKLDCRLEGKVRQPIKIIVDSLLRTPLDAKIWEHEAKVIIATTKLPSIEIIQKYTDKGAEVFVAGENRVDLAHLMKELGERGVDSILLEGGATLNASALQAGIVNEVWTFVAPKIVGGTVAPTSVGGEGVTLMKDAYQLTGFQVEPSGEDWLFKAKVNK